MPTHLHKTRVLLDVLEPQFRLPWPIQRSTRSPVSPRRVLVQRSPVISFRVAGSHRGVSQVLASHGSPRPEARRRSILPLHRGLGHPFGLSSSSRQNSPAFALASAGTKRRAEASNRWPGVKSSGAIGLKERRSSGAPRYGRRRHRRRVMMMTLSYRRISSRLKPRAAGRRKAPGIRIGNSAFWLILAEAAPSTLRILPTQGTAAPVGLGRSRAILATARGCRPRR